MNRASGGLIVQKVGLVECSTWNFDPSISAAVNIAVVRITSKCRKFKPANVIMSKKPLGLGTKLGGGLNSNNADLNVRFKYFNE